MPSLADRIESDLLHNILPFWATHAVDPNGAFYGAVSCDLQVDPTAERGMLLSARILWTFAAAFRAYGLDRDRAVMERAREDLLTGFCDPVHGGFIWSVHPDSSPARTRKQVYGQAFAIYAFTEHHLATGDPASLAAAQDLFHLLERHARDPEHGGYFEAFAADWSPIEDMRLSAIDLNTPKSQNTLLHLMEAYTNLHHAWPDPAVTEALTALVHLMRDRVLDPAGEHLRLFFDVDWTPAHDTISYGHDIEAAWLLVAAVRVLPLSRLQAEIEALAVRIANATLPFLDADGALLYEGNPREGVTKDFKEWWVQNEALVGFLEAHQLTDDPRFYTAAERIWEFCENHLIDHTHGEWFRATDRAGQPDTTALKISFWKCPYHNGRAALEAIRRLRGKPSLNQ